MVLGATSNCKHGDFRPRHTLSLWKVFSRALLGFIQCKGKWEEDQQRAVKNNAEPTASGSSDAVSSGAQFPTDSCVGISTARELKFEALSLLWGLPKSTPSQGFLVISKSCGPICTINILSSCILRFSLPFSPVGLFSANRIKNAAVCGRQSKCLQKSCFYETPRKKKKSLIDQK